MNKQQLKADLALLIATAFWGTTYVLTKFALDFFGPLNIISIRFILAAVTLVIIFHRRLINTTRPLLVRALLASAMLLLSFLSMNYALLYTSASNAAFIGGTTVLFVALFERLLLKRKLKKRIWLCVVLTLTGIGLLTINSDVRFVFGMGELLSLGCAVSYALYILLIDRFTEEYDPVALSTWQMFFIALASTLLTFSFETYKIPSDGTSWLVILLLAFPCTAIAYVAQILAQKYTTPTHASLIISLETVFAGLFAFVILREVLAPLNYVGAVLMFISLVIMEFPEQALQRPKSSQ